jgi:hypothetical protein
MNKTENQFKTKEKLKIVVNTQDFSPKFGIKSSANVLSDDSESKSLKKTNLFHFKPNNHIIKRPKTPQKFNFNFNKF